MVYLKPDMLWITHDCMFAGMRYVRYIKVVVNRTQHVEHKVDLSVESQLLYEDQRQQH